MPRIGICALGVSLVVLAAAPASGARGRGEPNAACRPPGSHPITSDSQATMYLLPDAEGRYDEAYGCALSRRRTYHLGRLARCRTPLEAGEEWCGGIAHEVLGGAMAAFEESRREVSPKDGGLSTWHVTVRDLATGRLVHTLVTATDGPPDDAEIDSGPTAAIVVKADGSVAWIAEVPNGEVTEYQLLAVGRAGRRVLAIATDIQPSSLTLAGNRLHWIEGGEPRSATLN